MRPAHPAQQPQEFVVLNSLQARTEAEAQLRCFYGPPTADRLRAPLILLGVSIVAALLAPELTGLSVPGIAIGLAWLFVRQAHAEAGAIPKYLLDDRANAYRGGLRGTCPHCGEGIVFPAHLRQSTWKVPCPACRRGLRFCDNVAYPGD